MNEEYLATIHLFAGNFAPRNFAFCDGQLLPISQYSALFSLLGTIYGGDGRTTFGLPDLRGRAPIHAGRGTGLTDRRLGSRSGQETVTLSTTEMPIHHHIAEGTTKAYFQPPSGGGDSTNPAGKVLSGSTGTTVYKDAAPNQTMAAGNVEVTVGNSGGGQGHNNMSPYLTVNYIICLVGLFPSRN